MKPLVSIITINYNSLPDTLEFLESVAGLSYPNLEVIVVDNDSREKPAPAIFEKYKNVTFIQSTQNAGFAGGNNLGISAANGEYLAFLNNDTLLPKGFLEPVIEFLEANPHIGIASTKVLYTDGKTIQYAGAKAINPYTGRGKRLGLFEIDHGQYDTNFPTDLGHGASLFVPRRVVNEVGNMPEEYFLYYEEHDWTEQIKRKGYKMYYIGTSYLIHKESISTGGDDSPLKVYYLSRNRILFLRRNFTGIRFLIGILFFSLVSTPKGILKYSIKGKFGLLAPFLKGIFWNLKN